MSKSKQSRPNVVSFIRKARIEGRSDDQIKSELLDAGWQIDVIDKAIEKTPQVVITISEKPSHFTKYSHWYTSRGFVYLATGFVILLIFIALFI